MNSPRRKQDIDSFLYTHIGGVGDETDLASAVMGADANINGSGISLEQCALSNATVTSAIGIQVRRNRWKTVDAANADMERSGWRATTILDSRFTGAKLNSSHIAKTAFIGCRMNLLQCQMATMIEVRFEGCDLRGAYFNASSMAGTVFEGSDLTGADFSGATITGCDFRRARIEDIRVAPEQMAEVIVTADQALYLARLFGLIIQE